MMRLDGSGRSRLGTRSHNEERHVWSRGLVALIAPCLFIAMLAPESWAKTVGVARGRYRMPASVLTGNPMAASRSVRHGPALDGTRFRRVRAGVRPEAYRAQRLGRLLGAHEPAAHRSDATAALYTGAGFPGMSDNGSWPADAQLAVGPQAIVEMTNAGVGVYTRSGFLLRRFALTDILGNSGDEVGDPQVAWDSSTGLWIASGMDITTNTTEISVSDGADPLGGWFDYSFAYGSRLCPDQPRLGFDSVMIVVATELFYGNCRSNSQSVAGGVMIAIDKQAMLAHSGAVGYSQYGPDTNFSNYVPVQMLGPSDIEYVASTDFGASSVVHVFTLQGVPPNESLTLEDTLLISTLRDPTYAAEAEGGVIYAGDDRINDASWLGGVLYVAADDRCTYSGDPYLETCARVMEISTTGPHAQLIGENDIGFPNADAYYAAVRPDAGGNLIAVFGYSSLTEYPSIAAIAAQGPIVGEQGGDFTDAIELAGGTSRTIKRWGDYQGAAVDPTMATVVWTVGQVADDLGSSDPHRWATHIDAVSLSASVPAAFPHQVDPGYLYRGRTMQHRRINIRTSGSGRRIVRVALTLGLRCRSGRDVVTFTLDKEAWQSISSAGRFHFYRRLPPDAYATSYTVTIAGTFAPGRVTGGAAATENSRTLGPCRARRVSFSAAD